MACPGGSTDSDSPKTIDVLNGISTFTENETSIVQAATGGIDEIGMLALLSWLENLTLLRGSAATILVGLALVALFVLWDWRVTLAALAAQYFLTDVAFLGIFDSRLVVIKIIASLFVWLILTLTAYQVAVRPGAAGWREPLRRPANWPLRLIGVLIGLALVWVSVGRFGRSTDALPVHLNVMIYYLIGAGALLAWLAAEPLPVGVGLLLFVRGFELFYHSLEQSSLILALLVGVNLMVALAIAYLMTVRPSVRLLPGEEAVA